MLTADGKRADRFSGTSGDNDLSFAVHRYVNSDRAAEYEDSSMVSTLFTQAQDCRPTTDSYRSEMPSMRLAQELGESGWDNGYRYREKRLCD